MIAVILDNHMTWVAVGYEIFKAVCFLVVGKISKSFDVMHVQRFAKLFLGYAATLTGMIVSCSRAASLPFPVSAIVGSGTTAPSMTILATPVVRLPVSEALAVAVETFFLFASSLVNNLVWLPLQSRVTPIARHYHWWKPAVSLFSHSFCEFYRCTISATKVFVLNLGWLATKHLATSRASYIDLIVLMVTLSLSSFGHPLLNALRGAKVVFRSFKAMRGADNFSPACMALQHLACCSCDCRTSAATGMNLCSFDIRWLAIELFLANLASDFHALIIPATRSNDKQHGSATTGLVALKHGRKYLGLELNESYIEMSHKRLLGVASQQRLFEAL